jgi:Cu-Zn family superoxide dismutase
MVSKFLLMAGFVLFTGCALAAPESRAIAELKNKDGKIIGQAFFRERSDGVLVRMDVKGLTPGLHGVHIHSVGKCEEPSFTTAGEHFNPAGKKHGLNSPAGPHAGDLPNMLVAKDGSRRFEVRTDAITFKVGAASVFDSDGAAP